MGQTPIPAAAYPSAVASLKYGPPEPLKPTMPGYANGAHHLDVLERRARGRHAWRQRRRHEAHVAILELIYWRELDLGMPITGQRRGPMPPDTRDTGWAVLA